LVLDSLDLARTIIDVIEDVKGENIVLIDLQDVTLIADYFIICTGNSDRQLKAIVEHIRIDIKDVLGVLPHHIEGKAASGWTLLDYSSVVVHVFSEELRDYYDLEGMWQEAKILLRMQ